MRFIFSIVNAICYLFMSPLHYWKFRGVKMGKNNYLYTKHIGSEPYLIEIGDNCHITSGTKFFTHGGGAPLRLEMPDFDTFGKIIIGNNVYIGNNCLIMPGVAIGDNVIIGAGSVVTKSIPSNCVVAGNPAKYIKDFKSYRDGMVKHDFKTKRLHYKDKKQKILTTDESLFIKKGFISIK